VHADSAGRCFSPLTRLTVAGVGDRCFRCFNEEAAQLLGVDFDSTPLEPVALTDVDGVAHTFEIRSMLVATARAEL
jgi:hypothetical protein